MKLLIIGIVIVVAVLGIVASQLGVETNNIDDVTLVVEEVNVSLDCMGTAKCFAGIVTEVIDGDTLKVNGESIRFSLSSAPELKGFGGIDSKNFIETICPVGSTVVVDEDDGQVLGSFGRIIGLVYCNDVILNQELLDAHLGYLEDRFCDSSEFSTTTWAVKHGC